MKGHQIALLPFAAFLVFAGGHASGEDKGVSVASSAGMIQDRTFSSPAGKLFVEKCAMCHRKLGMGTVLLSRRMDPAVAELEKRNDLTANYVILAARKGIGNMPVIPRGEVSDEQLRTIAEYLAKGKK